MKKAILSQVYFDFLVMRLLEIKYKFGSGFAIDIFKKAIQRWHFSTEEINFVQSLLETRKGKQ